MTFPLFKKKSTLTLKNERPPLSFFFNIEPLMEQKINIYTCPDGHQTVTVDRDEGVTPFIIDCEHGDCKKEAKSSFYRVDQTLIPTHEWYKPESTEGLGAWEKEHVEMGGLSFRKIES